MFFVDLERELVDVLQVGNVRGGAIAPGRVLIELRNWMVYRVIVSVRACGTRKRL